MKAAPHGFFAHGHALMARQRYDGHAYHIIGGGTLWVKGRHDGSQAFPKGQQRAQGKSSVGQDFHVCCPDFGICAGWNCHRLDSGDFSMHIWSAGSPKQAGESGDRHRLDEHVTALTYHQRNGEIILSNLLVQGPHELVGDPCELRTGKCNGQASSQFD